MDEVAVEAEDLAGVGCVPEDRPGQDIGSDGVEPEVERGDHAEVPAASPQRPEQVGMLVLGHPQHFALCRDDVGGEQVVDREAVLAHEPADAAAEGEPGDPRVTHDAAGGRQSVDLRLVVDVTPQSTTLHAGGAAGGVDPHGPHVREVDDDSVVAHGGPATLWPPPRTAISRPWSRANRTAAATSAAPLQRAMSRGWRSMAPFHMARASS